MTDAAMQPSDPAASDPRIAKMQAEAHTRGFAAGQARGAAAERKRAAAIMQSPEAVGRDDLAMHFAMHSDVTSEAAIAGLKASPRAAIGAPAQTEFDRRCEAGRQRMALREAPAGDAAEVSRILESYDRATNRR